MYRSRTFSISIRCPWDQVYEFLVEPLNLPTWTQLGTRIEHVAGPDWKVETEDGPLFVRYHPRNKDGILDHAIFREGEEPLTQHMRIVPNGTDGSELVYTIYQRPGMADEVFDSEISWAESDLLALKSLLEAR